MIDELEKLARAATPGPWYVDDDEDSDKFLVGPYSDHGIVTNPVVSTCNDDNASYIAASNPAAILELIQRLKVAEHHLGNILSDPFAEDCQECAVGTATSWSNAKAALARANGESK